MAENGRSILLWLEFGQPRGHRSIRSRFFKVASLYNFKSYSHWLPLLDTVVDELSKDPSKKFVYVEIAYFWRWWNEQTDVTKQLVRTLVDEGRLEFVIGAW